MRKQLLKRITGGALQALMTALLVFFSSLPVVEARDPSGSYPMRHPTGTQTQSFDHDSVFAQRGRGAPESQERTYEGLSPDERERLRGRSRKWEGLPREKRRELERRMERWEQLPPEERDLIRKRHQQWQQLSPQEQDRIRERLDRWDSLPPQEQEEIRRKFKRP
jgi:hypothetical protein